MLPLSGFAGGHVFMPFILGNLADWLRLNFWHSPRIIIAGLEISKPFAKFAHAELAVNG